MSDVLPSSMEVSQNNDSIDKEDVKSNADDDDVVIDETKSTPKPKALNFNLANVKLERSTSNEVEDGVPDPTEASTSEMKVPSISNSQVCMTTQTECGMAVKLEENQQRKEEVEMKTEKAENDDTAMEQSSSEVERKTDKDTEVNRSVKDSVEIERCSSAEIVIKPSLSDGSDRRTGGLSPFAIETSPVHSPLNIYHVPTLEAQEQQDNLLDLMNTTAQERDEFKVKAQSLALELEKKELKLMELTVKKEFSHQNVQTDPEKDYKTLYSQATQHNEQLTQTINELKKKQEEMLRQMKAEKEEQDRMKAQGAGPSTAADVEDEMALQTEILLSELDKRNAECQELKSKVSV